MNLRCRNCELLNSKFWTFSFIFKFVNCALISFMWKLSQHVWKVLFFLTFFLSKLTVSFSYISLFVIIIFIIIKHHWKLQKCISYNLIFNYSWDYRLLSIWHFPVQLIHILRKNKLHRTDRKWFKSGLYFYVLFISNKRTKRGMWVETPMGWTPFSRLFKGEAGLFFQPNLKQRCSVSPLLSNPASSPSQAHAAASR